MSDGRRSAGPDRVMAVDVVRCALPLERAVRIGATVYPEREYVALRVVTEAGVEGHAIGYTRGLPLLEMVTPLARAVLGTAVSRRAATLTAIAAANANAVGALPRALSLLEIALWDALARAAGLPLWRLLGGARERVPLTMVAGYAGTERGVGAVEDEIRALLDTGVRSIKLHTRDLELVRAACRLTRDRASVAVDLGMAWHTLTDAVAGCRPFDDLGLAFLEDPFRPSDRRLYPGLARALRTPLAAGEDASGPADLFDLVAGVSVLRVDATASGGFGPVLEVASAAVLAGRTVMTHAFPDLHGQLAGHPAVSSVEMIPDAAGVNPVGRLLARRDRIEGGDLVLGDEPGHGAPLDWTAVMAHAREVRHVDVESPKEA